jgi:hypothetical protein
MPVTVRSFLPLATLVLWFGLMPLLAQNNYEVQVYGADTVPRGSTMFEFHSNFTIQGSKYNVEGVYADQHAFHETLEITQGVTSWFETGVYAFTSYGPAEGYQYVGSHIRPRVRAPKSWNWPVNVSLSTEIGYERRQYTTDTWTWEIRPIVDKQLGRWYLAANPAFERSFHGPEVHSGVTFAPSAKISYDATKKVAIGLEYYGSLGSIRGFDPVHDQLHMLMPAIDIDFGPDWEFNFAGGVGLTAGTDHLLIKMIVGRRFNFGKN